VKAQCAAPWWAHCGTPASDMAGWLNVWTGLALFACCALVALTGTCVFMTFWERRRGACRMAAPAQAALCTVAAEPAAPVSGVPAGRFDPAAYDAALAGDGYGWLASLLGSQQPPACEACGRLMRLPAAAPVLWACPACHPGEAS
jgi:hypothetical protein